MELLSIDTLTFNYSDSSEMLFKNFSFQVKKGEIWAILGENGVGKTTLLRLIAQLLRPVSGEIYYQGNPLRKKRASQVAQQISMTFQNSILRFYCNTVEEEIKVTVKVKERDSKLVGLLTSKIIKLHSLETLKDSDPFSISGGEKRKVDLAITDALRPKCFLLDEPSASLDKYSKQQVIDRILQWRKQGSVIIATHDVLFALRVATKLLILKRDRNHYSMTVDEFLNREPDRLLSELNLPVPDILRINKSRVVQKNPFLVEYIKKFVMEENYL